MCIILSASDFFQTDAHGHIVEWPTPEIPHSSGTSAVSQYVIEWSRSSELQILRFLLFNTLRPREDDHHFPDVQASSHYLNQWLLVYWRMHASLGLNELKWMLPYLEPRHCRDSANLSQLNNHIPVASLNECTCVSEPTFTAPS